jgi:hypothetical protein
MMMKVWKNKEQMTDEEKKRKYTLINLKEYFALTWGNRYIENWRCT